MVFDVGGVLLTWDPPAFIGHVFPEPEIQQLVRREVFEHADWHEFDRGTLDVEAAKQHFARATGRSPAEIERLLGVARESLTPIPGTIALVEELAAANVGLYVLSNMPESTFEYLMERHAFFAHFDHLVISGSIRMLKPEPAIYRHLIETTGIDPARSVFLDDLPRNVEAARAAGLLAIQFRDAETARAELANYLPRVFGQREQLSPA